MDTKDVWKCSMEVLGVPYATTDGTWLMPQWCVESWDTQEWLLPMGMPISGKEEAQSGSLTVTAVVTSQLLVTAFAMGPATFAVHILMMLVLFAVSSTWQNA